MKNTERIFKLLLGVSVLIFSLAALSFSLTPTYATDGQQSMGTFVNPIEGGSGKYTLQLTQSNQQIWLATVFNTETGAYKMYYWDGTEEAWKIDFGGSKAFPDLP